MIVSYGDVILRQLDGIHGGTFLTPKLKGQIRKKAENLLSNPTGALDPQNALRPPLTGVWRFHLNDRIRVVYLVRPDHTEARVIFVGFRKDGDKDDVYSQLTRLLRGTALDAEFQTLGVTKPAV